MASSSTQPRSTAPSEIVSQSEIERLLAQVESNDPSLNPGGSATAGSRETSRRHNFPVLSLFSTAELRPLRTRHESFIVALAARLSIHLGLEVTMQMSKLEAVPFQTFVEDLSNPAYLSLTKLQPLSGICLLDIPPKLALTIVDRELGGPGWPPEELRPITSMESRLLFPLVTLILNEWCASWKDLLEIRPTVLGEESNGRYLTTSTPETSLLVVGIQATVGEAVDQIQLAFPHPMLEPLTLKLNSNPNSPEKAGATAKSAPVKWNHQFDDVLIEVKAQLPEIELPAGQIASLKPGDILTFPAEYLSQVRLLLADHPACVGTLGTSGKRGAVKIEKWLKN